MPKVPWGPTRPITVKLPIDKWELLRKICEARGENLADFVRRAIYRELARMGLLPAEEAKLLEIRL